MFPKGFKFGFSEAGFQFEMGLNDIDKNTDWYIWSRDKYNVENKLVSGDLPENGPAYWDLYRKDHDIAQSLGMNAARIGIEWSRIFPNSTESIKTGMEIKDDDILSVEIDDKLMEELDKIANKKALDHYRDMFMDLKKRGFYLIINLYHWSTPLWINDPSKRNIEKDNAVGNCFSLRSIGEFAKYAAYIAYKFGDITDKWITMNEPNMLFNGQSSTDLSPLATRIRKKLFVEAHCRAYDSIKKYSKKPVGIVYANGDMQALTEDDVEAKNKAEYEIRYSFFDAITKGDVSWYTSIMDENNKKHGNSSRDDLRNHLDWVGVNYYSRDVLKKEGDYWSTVTGYGYATGNVEKSMDNNPVSDTGWEIYPEGIYNLVMSYQKHLNLPMMITENGLADASDKYRAYYIASHLKYLEKAYNDGAKIEGYLHWALTDNYEWANGFSMKFGLASYDEKTKERTVRNSAEILKEIIKENTVNGTVEGLIQK